MALRVPRGYGKTTVDFTEVCEGVRPNPQSVPLKAWTGLPAIYVDELRNDPVVIPAGTVIGIAQSGTCSGWVVPATRAAAVTPTAYSNQNSYWGIQSTYTGGEWGNVKPIGICYKPIYSFNLQENFTNYKREYTVPFLTDYVIEIPATWSGEHYINAGDKVSVTTGAVYSSTNTVGQTQAGRLERYEDTITGSFTGAISGAAEAWGLMKLSENVIGTCLQTVTFGSGGASEGNTWLAQAKAGNASLTTAGKSEYKNLDMVQTVPGLDNAGSGSYGVPTHLTNARADTQGLYKSLTILVRL